MMREKIDAMMQLFLFFEFGFQYFGIDDRTPQIERQIDCKRVAVVVLGLEVPHAHIHLIPIKSESDVDFRREKLSLTPEEFQAIAAKLNR